MHLAYNMSLPKYSKIECEPFLDDDSDATGDQRGVTKGQSSQGRRLFVVLFSTNVVVLGIALFLSWQYFQGPSQLQCAKVNSPFSPLWDGVKFWEGNFDNEFPHESIYRGPPTPEREKAWEDLWLHPAIKVPAHGMSALNKTDRAYMRSDDGEGYSALVEVFHQLHCLNLVRQYTWRHLYSEEDMPPDFYEPVAARMHVDHCIETLRLSLMCYADVTPLLVYEDPKSGLGFRADFNVHHKCRNFDDLVDYVKKLPKATESLPKHLPHVHADDHEDHSHDSHGDT